LFYSQALTTKIGYLLAKKLKFSTATSLYYEARGVHRGADALSPFGNMLYYSSGIFNWGIGTMISISALVGLFLFSTKIPKKL